MRTIITDNIHSRSLLQRSHVIKIIADSPNDDRMLPTEYGIKRTTIQIQSVNSSSAKFRKKFKTNDSSLGVLR